MNRLFVIALCGLMTYSASEAIAQWDYGIRTPRPLPNTRPKPRPKPLPAPKPPGKPPQGRS
jgi:hypothetical protein